jgi:Zn-dependent peptidase ImmA (M78 family)/DNA-binding XRE family transcriptional regulator
MKAQSNPINLERMNGERLRQARELCDITQTELATDAEVAQSAIAQIESGQYTPSDSVARSLALNVGFDLSFLCQDTPPVEFPIGSILYRSKAKVTPKEKTRAHRMAQLLFEIATVLMSKLRPIPVLLPCLNEADPAEAAKLARSNLGLSPDTPIPNIIAAFERAGVLVFRLPLEIDGLDGFSVWAGKNSKIPVICLVGRGIGYRDRYTASEEGGHLILHQPMRCSVEQAETEVKPFTGEFVLPEDAMRREMKTPVTLSSLATLRPRWGASIQFLAKRSNQLGMTSPNQYRYLAQQISAKGWRTNKREPGDDTIQSETPRLFRKMIESVYGTPMDIKRLRKDLGIPMSLLRSLLAPYGIGEDNVGAQVVAMRKSS